MGRLPGFRLLQGRYNTFGLPGHCEYLMMPFKERSEQKKQLGEHCWQLNNKKALHERLSVD